MRRRGRVGFYRVEGARLMPTKAEQADRILSLERQLRELRGEPTGEWTRETLAAECEARGWRLVHSQFGATKQAISPFRAERTDATAIVHGRSPERLLSQIDAHEAERRSLPPRVRVRHGLAGTSGRF